jgi:hypothetical protein
MRKIGRTLIPSSGSRGWDPRIRYIGRTLIPSSEGRWLIPKQGAGPRNEVDRKDVDPKFRKRGVDPKAGGGTQV